MEDVSRTARNAADAADIAPVACNAIAGLTVIGDGYLWLEAIHAGRALNGYTVGSSAKGRNGKGTCSSADRQADARRVGTGGVAESIRQGGCACLSSDVQGHQDC